jgi:hypothetical protein
MAEYFSFDPATCARGGGFPAPGADVAGQYQNDWFGEGGWDPNAPADPHDNAFEVGDGPPDVGPTPSNIVVDSPPDGPFSD